MTALAPRRRSPLVVLGGLALALGCIEGPQAVPEPMWTTAVEPGKRTLRKHVWKEAWVLGGPGDPLLARPRHLTGLDGLFVWWDDYDHAIHAASADGELLWSFGREGEGPSEFRAVSDVAVDATGDIVLLDGDVRRITVLQADGTLQRQVRLPEGHWRSVAPQPDGSWVLAGIDGDRPFVHVDVTGRVLEGVGAAWDGFADLSLIQRQGSMIAGDEGRWAFAFLIGNGWLPYRGLEALPYLGRSVEHTRFPEMVVVASGGDRVSKLAQRPNCSVCSGWLSGDTLTVLFGGYGPRANRLLDRYSWSDGRYLGSLELPATTLDVTRAGGLIVALEAGMEPRIVGYRVLASDEGDGAP